MRISAISMFEAAVAVARGRLELSRPLEKWIIDAIEIVIVEPITAELCLKTTQLPIGFHRDPGDLMIVTLARSLDAELVTADAKILRYPHVRTIDAG